MQKITIADRAQFYLDRKDYSPGSDFERICKGVILLSGISENQERVIKLLKLEKLSVLAIAQRLYDCLNEIRHHDDAQELFEDEELNIDVEEALQMFETARAKDIEVASP